VNLSWETRAHYEVRCLGGRPAGRALTLGGAQELARQWEEAGHGPVTIETVYATNMKRPEVWGK
jgi:hypothetical protein